MEKDLDGFESKTARAIFFGMIGIVPVSLLVNLIISSLTGRTFREMMIEQYYDETMHGVVDSVYDDKQNHNTRMVIFTNKMTYKVEQQQVIDIEKGDSISKNMGSFLFEVYRKPGKKLVLDFRTLIPPKKQSE